ncbi:GDP-mannose 4,6-dehydratase [hydrothermal vent metagenome]|uniref:GDP-mannose 4,6-dehydratase n=1 Tax=hydrothermal vent metagenome TaxID=652676 RepID=A0A3B1D4E1_9ZZZZ
MKNLITGIHGFVGSHLADCLLAQNEEVTGLARSMTDNGNVMHIEDKIQVWVADVNDRVALKKILAEVRPERVYHLAAMSFPPDAEKEGSEAFATNFTGTLNLLQAVKELQLNCRVLFAGSSEAYGIVTEQENPVKETQILQPVSLYGVSKASAEMLAQSYFLRDGLDVVRVRPFNHIGPRQNSRFVCSAFSRQIAMIEKGADAVMQTGNLESYRDFMDVRDTVRAYTAIMEKAGAGEVFNVCSGQAVSVQSILDGLLEISGIPIRIERDNKLYREEEPVRVAGDLSLLTEKTGWRPEIPLKQTLHDLLSHWRENS